MYIFTPNEALSIIATKDPDTLLVRSRTAGDIEKFLRVKSFEMKGGKPVFTIPNEFDLTIRVNAGTDYKYRASASRARVMAAALYGLSGLHYDNVKGACRGNRAALMAGVWAAYLTSPISESLHEIVDA